jgi:hypothetical protein
MTDDVTTKKTKTRKYVVRAGCKICIEKDVYSSGGDVVELTAKFANHYNKIHMLDPYVGNDDD